VSFKMRLSVFTWFHFHSARKMFSPLPPRLREKAASTISLRTRLNQVPSLPSPLLRPPSHLTASLTAGTDGAQKRHVHKHSNAAD
jgi:hypothetical protein